MKSSDEDAGASCASNPVEAWTFCSPTAHAAEIALTNSLREIIGNAPLSFHRFISSLRDSPKGPYDKPPRFRHPALVAQARSACAPSPSQVLIVDLDQSTGRLSSEKINLQTLTEQKAAMRWLHHRQLHKRTGLRYLQE